MVRRDATPTDADADAPTPQDFAPVSFDEKDSRKDDMRDVLEGWVQELADDVEDARESDRLQEFLDFQASFHDYSWKNTLLIKRQMPEATYVAGFNTWINEHNRHVKKGESAIYVWGPITVDHRCPECHNNPEYHERAGCEYDDEPPEEWDSGVVGFRPVPVFDISQTEPIDDDGDGDGGGGIPEIDMSVGAGAVDDPAGLRADVLAAGDRLGFDVSVVPSEEWDRSAGGITKHGEIEVIEVEDGDNAGVVATLVHEYAHAELHGDGLDDPEKEAREAEAEAAAYVVGRYFGLEMDRSADYLAVWTGDDTDRLRNRLKRISGTAQSIIDAIEE